MFCPCSSDSCPVDPFWRALAALALAELRELEASR